MADSLGDSPGSLNVLKRNQSKFDRLRLLAAAAFSICLHLVLFFGFNEKPAKVAEIAKPVILVADAIQVPIEEPETTPEDVVESTSIPNAAEFPPPSQPELLRIPVDTDFTMIPLPPAPASTGPTITQFVIPQSAGRTGGPVGQKIFTLSELDRAPQVIRSEKPNYPIELINAKVSGLVVVRFIVDATGDVQNVKIVSTPHTALGAAVASSLTRWRFKAGMKGGRAVSTMMELPVEFAPEQL